MKWPLPLYILISILDYRLILCGTLIVTINNIGKYFLDLLNNFQRHVCMFLNKKKFFVTFNVDDMKEIVLMKYDNKS